MPYDRFNYSGVYWHQRLDNHPLLYYSLVHTFCSLFPDSYSIWYALIINVMALLLIDAILIRIGRLLFRERYAGAVLILTSMMMVVFYGMVSLARMYMLLALICLWFLYISLRIVKEMQVSMPEILLCVFLGSQIHYYFYVYAAVTGLIILMILLVKKRWKELLKILTAASMGEFLSLILFPWVVWHIVFNQMGKNESLYVWSQQQVRDYICFLNQTVFNGRGSIWICFTVMTVLLAAFLARKGRVQWMPAEGKIEWLVIAPGILIYSILIYTLNVCGRLLCNAGLSACLYFNDFCCDYIYTDCGGTFSRHKEKNRSTRRQKIRIVTRSHVNSVNGSPDEWSGKTQRAFFLFLYGRPAVLQNASGGRRVSGSRLFICSIC